MELEILRLIYNYSRASVLADNSFVNKLIEIVVKHQDLHEYVKTVEVIDDLSSSNVGVELASYTPLMKLIRVYSGSIEYSLEHMDHYGFYGFEYFMLGNLHVAHTILHELEHAHQFKIAGINKDIEGDILRASLALQLEIFDDPIVKAAIDGRLSDRHLDTYISALQAEKRETYEQNYILDPAERLAEAKSMGTLLDSLNDIKHTVPDIYDFGEVSLYTMLLRGYRQSQDQGGICPTLSFLLNTRREYVWDSFGFVTMQDVLNRYSLKDRLYFGLPIMSSEQEDVEQYTYMKDKFGIN